MSEWKEYKLGDICDITSSRRIFLNEYVKEGVPFYRSKEIIEKAKGNNISTELFITYERYDEIKRKNFVPVENDILITSVGTLGVSYMLSKKDFFYFKDGNLTWLRNYSNLVYPKYLLYWLRSNIAKEKFNEISIGSTQPAITIQGLKGLQLKLPKHSTQTAIAEILSSLDDKIELNNKINQELENLAQTLFKQWFIDFEFPNENGEPYKSSGGEMVDSELGEIPNGWEVVTIDDVTETVTKGTTPTTIGGRFTEKGINFIKVESLTESGAFIKSKFAHIDDETNLLLKRSIIKNGDVLFSIAGTIGRVAVVTNEILPANTNQAIAIIRPNKISSYFLKILMQSSLIQNDTQSNIVQAVQANLSLGIIKLTKFILPPINILSKIDIQLNNIYDNINHLVNENENLTTLRDTLLPKLISGELEINEITN